MLIGAASLWDFHGLLTPRIRVNPVVFARSDADALANDWEVVGNDLRQFVPALEEHAGHNAEGDDIG